MFQEAVELRPAGRVEVNEFAIKNRFSAAEFFSECKLEAPETLVLVPVPGDEPDLISPNVG